MLATTHHGKLNTCYRRLPARYRWYLLLVALLLGYLLVLQVRDAMLPAHVWLTRCMESMRDGRYEDAGRFLARAQAMAPHDAMTDMATHVFLWHQSHDTPLAQTRFYYLGALEKFIGWSEEREHAWRKKNEVGASELLHQTRWPAQSFKTLGVAAAIFDDCWCDHPQEVISLTQAVLNLRQGRYQPAWNTLSQFEQRQPALFRTFRQTTPLFLRVCAEAAWYSGHPRDAQRYYALYRKMPLFWYNSYDDYIWASTLRLDPSHAPDDLYCCLQLPPASHPVESTVWSLRGNNLVPGFAEPTGELPQLLLLPDRSGVQLLSVPASAPTAPGIDLLGWWRWDGGGWQPSDAQTLATLRALLPHGAATPENVYCLGSAAHGSHADFLALAGIMYGRETRLLLRDRGSDLRKLDGYTPQEIIMQGDDLWVHESSRITRIANDSKTLSLSPTASFKLNDAWRLATDGAGQLWLVSWDGRLLLPRAVWTGSAFRLASTAEQASATQGFLDGAGKIWFTTALPAGFTRESWRHTFETAPVFIEAGQYAVDGKGRIWVNSGGLLARWEGKWVNVPNPLLDRTDTSTTLLPTRNGVMLLTGSYLCRFEYQ